MKNLIVFILILFLMPQIAHAETKIFSGTVITDSDKVIDGSTFRFKYDESSKKAFVDTPAGGLIVENGACKPNNVFRVCINRANFSYKNITTYVYYYEVDTTIYKLTGSLSSSSKAMLSSLLQNEATEITIAITNPTDFDISNIAFNYNLQNFSAIGAKGCELNGNILGWKGSLQSKYDKTCTATIYSGKEGKYGLSGNLSYFNGYEMEKKTTDSLPITVLPKQLKVSQILDKNIEVKKPFYLNLSLQNMHPSEEINGFSTITLPSHVSLIKETPTFEKSARILKRALILNPNTGVNYSFYLEKSSEGKEPIKLRFNYAIKNINEETENSTFVDVISPEPAIKKPEPEIKQEKQNETADAAIAVSKNETAKSQASQAKDNKTTETKPISESKAEQIIAETLQKPSFIKNILLIGASILAGFVIVLAAVFRMKGKKKDDAMEKLKEELKDNEIK
ncbi:hypothetical protein HYX07_05480 [Candidatus Woesearchaeota archaeon]|nr:hypothetical protein [Candidatus Woesearchaeota archaeon]